jgi:PKD repeat protein
MADKELTHTYATPGTYTIIVTDSDAKTATAEFTATAPVVEEEPAETDGAGEDT